MHTVVDINMSIFRQYVLSNGPSGALLCDPKAMSRVRISLMMIENEYTSPGLVPISGGLDMRSSSGAVHSNSAMSE